MITIAIINRVGEVNEMEGENRGCKKKKTESVQVWEKKEEKKENIKIIFKFFKHIFYN